ncbi:fasciclin domain-containing protein [Fodinibius sediminis]|uniref:Uncaracterized surface protein containing fasciclin (FAS1) repeats n=1 Tax=Fodinibius sediminis TaxID=1214077 RepID=A0A521BHC9_9BACT|nr:fasciclin domain-containing protein [Fodinibius sediminis]SMO46439.1 Uncaracterized surface protein containing fasciclin (FAS1) repeats [Fodinibius sediminis]
MDTLIYNPSKKSIAFWRNGLIALLALVMLQACDDDDGPTNPPDTTGNIAEVASSDDNFSTLVSALTDAGLVATLEGDGPFTVFAPTNDAFAKLPDGLLASLSNEQLVEILSYHVVGAEIASGDLQSEQTVEALAGGELFVTANGGVTVNDAASVITADVEASNGIIHAIDTVLLPDSYQTVVGIIAKRYGLQALENAVVQAELAGTLSGDGPFTVFAPSDAAFENVDLSGLSQEELKAILTYHVLPQEVLSADVQSGTVETVNGATIDIQVDSNGGVTLTDQAGNTSSVTTVDLQGTNGVVHIIDGVLLPAE